MTTLRDIALSRRSRKGAPHRSGPTGTYWLALDEQIDQRALGVHRDYFRVRHYRTNELRAYCETETWRKGVCAAVSRVRCDQILDCDNVQDLILAIERVPLDRESGQTGSYRVRLHEIAENLAKELPLKRPPSPDDE